MKKIKWLALVIAVVLMLSVMVACNDDQAKEYTVTYYDGANVLSTENVVEGKTANSWTPTKDGYTFDGWYATPNFSHPFDFTSAINKDTSVFAKFSSAQQVDDTREFAIVGNGTSPLLASSNWGKVITEDHKMTKTDGENVYTITTDLYENDQFQFAADTSWNHQRGFGYIVDPIKDEVEYFSADGGLGDTGGNAKKNINVKVAGNYTFTLTTHPADDLDNPTGVSASDRITWVRNGDATPLNTDKIEFYIKGEKITDWKDMYNDSTRMAGVSGVHTLTVYLVQNDQFMFTSMQTIDGVTSVGTTYIKYANLDATSQELFDNNNGNIKVKENGEYKFTYTEETEVLSVSKQDVAPAEQDYYLDGTFGGGAWGDFMTKDGLNFVQSQADSNVYTIEDVVLAVDDELVIRAYAKDATPSWDNIAMTYQISNVFGAGSSFSAASDSNANIKVLRAGTYNITFNSYSKMITFENTSLGLDVYISGSMAGQTGWDPAFDAQWKFTKTAEGVYEITLTFEEGVQFGLRTFPEGTTAQDGVPHNWVGLDHIGEEGDANAIFNSGASNFVCSIAGTYRVVYNSNTGLIDVYNVVE